MPTTVAYQSIISCKRVVFRLAWCRVGRLMALPSDPCDICLLLWCCLDETQLCGESRLLLDRYCHRTLSPVHTRPRITGLRMRPMRSISTSTTSPSCKKSGGVRLNPTPDGVPVAMISPGSSVMRELRKAITEATEKTILAVGACCAIFSFTLEGGVCGLGFGNLASVSMPVSIR